MATPSEADAGLKATCHCSAVTIRVPRKPRKINECQCTLCRRYGVAWGYYSPDEVKVQVADGSPTKTYVWGDRELEFHFCSVCGYVTHWKRIAGSNRTGVNTRLMNPDELQGVDRVTSYTALGYTLKDKDLAHPEDRAQY